jgi:Zn-finger nucleic acid-binding protein
VKQLHLNPRIMQTEPIQRCKLKNCKAACCIYGVWIDSHEVEQIRERADIIQSEMPEGWNNPDEWFDGREEDDEHAPSGKVFHSRVVNMPKHYGGSACVFLREDHKCAIQKAAQKARMHPWSLKPFYCILHPLYLDEKGRITLDETDLLLDEPGSCLRPSAVPFPLMDTFEPELRYLLGDQEYSHLRLLIS